MESVRSHCQRETGSLLARCCNTDEHLYIVVEDDGPGIPLSKREVIFDRGQRVDTLRPGQGVGLAVAREITEQYEGKIVAGESMLGGARMEVIFGRQHSAPKDE